MKIARAGVISLLLSGAVMAAGQEGAEATYSRVNAFSAMAEYANDSSHIFLGEAENEKIGAVGFEYQRRVLRTRWMDFSYTAELRPVMIVSQPTAQYTYFLNGPGDPGQPIGTQIVARCVPGRSPYGDDPDDYVVAVCGRQSTFAEGLSPVGFRMNFLTRHRLQAVFSNYEGYMFSMRPIPVPEAGAFNFTFEFGVGLEWYQTHRRSVRLEYALQHFSNKDSANQNPGVDSGFVKLTYSFGR